MGTKNYQIVGGHLYLYMPFGGTAVPATVAAEEFLLNALGRSRADKQEDGGYKLNINDAAALDAAWDSKHAAPETLRFLCDMLNDRVPVADYERAVQRAGRLRNQLRALTISKLNYHKIGEATHFQLFAYRDINYVKGVRVHTTAGRRVDFYGARREDVSVVAIDGVRVGLVGDEPDTEILFNCKHVTEHLLEDAREKWRGKQKVEREIELGNEVLII